MLVHLDIFSEQRRCPSCRNNCLSCG
jgi:hypothetical protein